MTTSLRDVYKLRYEAILVPIASSLEQLLVGYLRGRSRIDRIAVRAKTPKSFLRKAAKKDNGVLRYSDPLGEIQDQIGARVVVFYTSDVDPICRRISRYFRHIEMLTKEPPSEAEFGYFGKHYILALPHDVIPSGTDVQEAPKVFELQVRTLFQHAWSEAEHDLGYKPQRELTSDEKRKFAFTAAQSWGADRIFQDLYDDIKEQ
jgi:ppGpp synthetase/RelA/SpoT-type nucleotidyltranferase